MSQYLLFGLISALFIVAICGAAWIFVIRYELMQRMAKIETDSTRLAVFEMRLNELISKPDVSSSAIKSLADDIQILQSNIKGIKLDAEQSEESIRRLVNKFAARSSREAKEVPSAPALSPPGDSHTDILEALKGSGIAVPLGNPSPRSNGQPTNFGHVAR